MIGEHEPSYYVLSCVNIDNFKVINAQHGTAVGDKVIHYVAESIENSMEQIGRICAHIASDEFASLYPSECMRSEALRKDTPRRALRTVFFSVYGCAWEGL